MKNIKQKILAVLLLFIIISTSSATATTPIAATLKSPKNNTYYDNIPTYKWYAVNNSSWYYLWVNDSTGNKIRHWYTAEQSGCNNGEQICSITPETPLADGSVKWWIRTWNSDGNGLWSDMGNFNLGDNNVPTETTLKSPITGVHTNLLTYEWQAVTDSTWYYLWVNDSSGNKIKKWYTAEQLGCGNQDETSICSITPTTALTEGSVEWWVRTWNNIGYGAWSKSGQFNISKSGVYILPNYTNYTNSINYLHIIGEVQNNTSNYLKYVKLSANIFDSNDNLLDTSFTFSSLDILAPHQKTCFDISFSQPVNWSYFQFETPTYHEDNTSIPQLTVYNHSGSYEQTYGWYRVIGLVKNNSNETVRYVQPIATLYNSAGKVIDCDYTFVNGTDLDSNESSSFEMTFTGRDNYIDASTYKLQVDGLF